MVQSLLYFLSLRLFKCGSRAAVLHVGRILTLTAAAPNPEAAVMTSPARAPWQCEQQQRLPVARCLQRKSCALRPRSGMALYQQIPFVLLTKEFAGASSGLPDLEHAMLRGVAVS